MAAVISSIKDEHLAQVRALLTRAGRTEAGGCLLEGAALIGAALDAAGPLRFAIRAEGADPALAGRLAEAGVPILDVRESVLRQIFKTPRPVAWAAVADLAEEAPADQPYGDFAVVLDNVADPGNLGTIVRTAVGLGVRDVVCADPGVDLTSRKVLDASRAAVLRARIRRFPTVEAALAGLRERGFEIVATSSRAGVRQADTPLRGGRVALVVGNETEGVGPAALDLADHVVRIPMSGEVESLNVGVAAGISVYELRAKALLRAALDQAGSEELTRALDGLRRLGAPAAAALLRLFADPDADVPALARRVGLDERVAAALRDDIQR